MIDVGQIVGNYKVTGRLGEGGMGTVFLAEHPVIGSKVALKVIHPRFVRDAEVFARFVNEAKAVNQIGHDHIIDITDFGATPTGDFYCVMEYLQGQTLLAAINGAGPFPPARALNIGAQIADALHASHQHGVIHRDLKPENIFLIARDDAEDFVKVLDFGLAKLLHADQAALYESRAGAVMGTPYYMSPEQCEGRSEIDHRADIYALGVILFEMLTGKIPFSGQGFGEVLVKHITVESPSVRSIVPELPLELDAILFRCLAKDPNHRFQTMADLREALLDPERHGPLQPARPSVSHQGAAARAGRSALPMARTSLAGGPRRGAALYPARPETLGPSPSTFREGTGEVWIREGSRSPNLAPKKHRVRRALLVAGAVAVTIAAGMKFRHETTRLLDGAAANMAARRAPATVRLSFSSDPQGAAVTVADGGVLGVTPLSIDVPSGQIATTYMLRKAGYLPKAASIVPNVSLLFFAVLRRDEPAPLVTLPALASAAAEPRPRVAPPSFAAPRKNLMATRRAPFQPNPPATAVATTVTVARPLPDRDDVLEPGGP